MTNIAKLDGAPPGQAAEILHSCCGASRWVSAMVARRPYGSRDALLAAADEVWRSLTPADWHEAFRRHPRIGEQRGTLTQPERGQTWSAGEQAGMHRTDDDVRRMIAAANHEYEERFGYIYIVNATGKTADEMLALVRSRLSNNPDLELHIAASEQQQIMRLRLEKLLADDASEGSAA